MSKGKIISIPTSVEAQIRTRARNLPIHKCYINEDWMETQMANILITRKHTNGNFTIGGYLVDLKLRGVKDCLYKFNESPQVVDENIERYSYAYEECDYDLIHNIIYAGLEFAEDYGFEPHKDFKVAQYILEEDTDDIPLMEIPLGDDGVPVLELHPGESGQREIAILKKTAGRNFRIAHIGEDGEEPEDERSYMDILEEIIKSGVENYINEHGVTLSYKEKQVINDMLYIYFVYDKEENTLIDETFDLIVNDPRLLMKQIVDDEDDLRKEFALPDKYFGKGQLHEAYAEIRKLIDRYPDNPIIWIVLLNCYADDSEKVDEEAVKEAYSRFPDHPVIKAWYAEWLAQEGKTDEVFALFNHLPGLDALTTENIPINFAAMPPFCFAYAMAYINKGDILSAEPYYQIIAKSGFNFRLSYDIQDAMEEIRLKKLNEITIGNKNDEDDES